MTDLAIVDTSGNPMAIERRPASSEHEGRMQLITAVAKGEMSPENAKVAMDMFREMKAMDAAEQFAFAKAKLQSELEQVVANKIIPTDNGTTRSTYASYEHIMKQIQPVLTRHQFTVDFDQEFTPERIIAICRLSHGGHTAINKFAVRNSPPPKTSAAQADSATWAQARRKALEAALNIVVDHDTDARLEGDIIEPEQAADLEVRLKALGHDPGKFLKHYKLGSFAEVRLGEYGSMLGAIVRNERKAAKKTNTGAVSGGKAGPVSAQNQPNVSTTAPVSIPSPNQPGAAEPSNAPGLVENAVTTPTKGVAGSDLRASKPGTGPAAPAERTHEPSMGIKQAEGARLAETHPTGAKPGTTAPSPEPTQCPDCLAYSVVAGTCKNCGVTEPTPEEKAAIEFSEMDLAALKHQVSTTIPASFIVAAKAKLGFSGKLLGMVAETIRAVAKEAKYQHLMSLKGQV